MLKVEAVTKQVLSLTTHIENGFQMKLISEAVPLDLSSALLLKLVRILKCKITIRLFEKILANRNFIVNLNGEIGKKIVIQNGLP